MSAVLSLLLRRWFGTVFHKAKSYLITGFDAISNQRREKTRFFSTNICNDIFGLPKLRNFMMLNKSGRKAKNTHSLCRTHISKNKLEPEILKRIYFCAFKIL